MIFKVNMIQDDDSWWVDSGATRHVCKDKALFKTYEPVEDGAPLYIGNSSTAQVLGKGSVVLEFTSEKSLTLNDVYHVPKIRRNPVLGSILNRFGFKMVFEADKFVLSKGGVFVGKGYLYDGMFKLSITNNKNVITYVCDSFYLWHFRLGHVHFK